MSKSSKDYVYDNLDVFTHVPEYLKNKLNSSFSRNLFDKFLTKEESIPVYGLAGSKTANDTDSRPILSQVSTERKINTLIPMIYAKMGSEENVYSFSDIINKSRLLGINVKHFDDWGSCQSFNFVPPIDIDKFINFSSYYWYGKNSKSEIKPSWNQKLDPEFYVIARPNISDRHKFPAELTNSDLDTEIVLTGSGSVDQTYTIEFSDSENYTVTANITGETAPGNINQFDGQFPNDRGELSSYLNVYFTLTNGSVPFASGDKFVLTIEHLSDKYSYTFSTGNNSSSAGKGGISGISGAKQYRLLNGKQTYEGQRVLIKNQLDATKNGVYVVSAGAWALAEDFLPENLTNGAVVQVSTSGNDIEGLYELQSDNSIIKIGSTRNVSEWSEFNFWIHEEDAIRNGIDLTTTVQARRPIIEYAFDLELNDETFNGQPSAGRGLKNAVQKKIKFNQLPQFNLYLANGDFAKKVSPIFFYEEDQTAKIDECLLRRIKLNDNADYVFSQGCIDSDESILLFKQNDALKSIWCPGVTEAQVSSCTLLSSSRGFIDVVLDNVNISNLNDKIRNSNWSCLAIEGKKFSLTSTTYPEVNVDVPFDTPIDVFNSLGTKLFTITITSGSDLIPTDGVAIGDTIKFRTINVERSRYVSGETISTASEVEPDDELQNGVWTTPFQLEYNCYHENRKSIIFGDLISHFKSIIGNQPGFTGSPFGKNNFRNIKNKNLGLGGKIKENNSSLIRYISLINQENISPISIIDFAESQYLQALNSINEYVNKYAIEFLTATGCPSFNGDEETSQLVDTLVDQYCDYYSKRVDLSYFADSTSPIPNWPATLPSLGMSASTYPKFGFDNDLGINVIIHHDFHLSPKNQRNIEFDRGLTQTEVTRSDGSTSPGVFSTSAPTRPYKNQLWFNSQNAELKIFNVISDESAAPAVAKEGDFWFVRSSGVLYQYINSSWIEELNTSAPWIKVETDKILNAFILNIERRIFNSLNPNQKTVWVPGSQYSLENLEFEFVKFAAKYGYDPFAPDYKSDDAFTWNYSTAIFPFGTGVARWNDVYTEYFSWATGTQYPTCRPNIEPWKIVGFNDKPSWFETEYAGVYQLTSNLKFIDVSIVCIENIAGPQSAPTMVDGRQLVTGDRILVPTGEFAGIYIVQSDATWSLSATEPMVNGKSVKVKYGSKFTGTTWFVKDETVGEFEQLRRWKISMWKDIKDPSLGNKFPNPGSADLRLCVNIWNEELLPPYVDPLNDAIHPFNLALLTSVPASANLSYAFGQGGPTETVWKKSLEFAYSLIRSDIKNQPLKFLECAWGDSVRSVGTDLRTNPDDIDNRLVIDKHVGKKLSHKEVILHGESIQPQIRTGIIYYTAHPVSGGEKSVLLTCDSVSSDFDSFKINVNGVFSGWINDFDQNCGIDFSNILISDEGKGFEIGDTISFDISETGEISNVVFTPATKKIIQGVGQWYTQLMKYNSYSLTNSRNNTLFRNWDIQYGYRFGSFMNTDTLRLSNVFDIPTGMCNILTKVSPYAGSSWLNALRIQLVKVGSTKLDNGIYKPAGQGDDWVFRVENYFNQYPVIKYYDVDTSDKLFLFDTFTNSSTKIQVQVINSDLDPALLSKYRVKSISGSILTLQYVEEITVNGITSQQTHSATVKVINGFDLLETENLYRYMLQLINADFVTFKSLELRRSPDIWKNYTQNLGVKTMTTPFLIEGVQNVVNFLFGYTRYLQDQGWTINADANPDIDAETGRIVTWQLEIEKFIDAVYDNMLSGQGVIINPFMSHVWFNAPKGLVSKFETIRFLDVSASQFAFDILGRQIDVSDLKIIREEDVTAISSDTPIFGAHVNVEFYEHCVLFPYYLDTSKKKKLIFDPFLGMKLNKILVEGARQAVDSARPSFGGFYLNNNQMKRNIVASIDNLGKIYDAENAFNNPEISKYALALFGFKNKDYFDDLGTSKKNQFNFWRGMIQAKGTNSSIGAFLNNSAFEDARIDEYWAFKVAEYGDARPKSFPEMKLKVSDCLLENTRFQFTETPSIQSFISVVDNDEDRWYNLDDIQELKDPRKPGMYFDAVSIAKYEVGSNITDIVPALGDIVQKINGTVTNNLVKYVDGNQKVKKLGSHLDYSIKIKMRSVSKSIAEADDPVLDKFDVYKVFADGSEIKILNNIIYDPSDNYGLLNETFICSDFEFKLTTDFVSMSYASAINDFNDVNFGTGPNSIDYEFDIQFVSDFYDEASDTFIVSRFVKLPFIADKLVCYDENKVLTDISVFAKQISANILQLKGTTPFFVEGFGPQKPKFSPIKLFDYRNDTFIGNIPYWNPALGQHTPEAYETINVISTVDPAKYNQTTKEIDNQNYDALKPWGKKEVGRVWWNTKNLDYIPYYDETFYPELENRLSKWGSTAEYSSINVYEWVESDVPPAEYNARVLSDAKNPEIQQGDKKSGEVAISKFLTRTRTWKTRPIAWKKNEKAMNSMFFTSAMFNSIKVTNTSAIVGQSTAILNYGKFSDYSVFPGMSLSAWDNINDIPVGQAKVTNDIGYLIGSESDMMIRANDNMVVPSEYSSLVDISVSFSQKKSNIGKALGKIMFSWFQDGVIFKVKATEINTGNSQSLPVSDFPVGATFVDYDFDQLGIKVRVALK